MKRKPRVLEVVITLAILACLYSVIYQPDRQDPLAAKLAKAKGDTQSLKLAIRMYHEEYNTFPPAQETAEMLKALAGDNPQAIHFIEFPSEVVEGGFAFRDPWGAIYSFTTLDDNRIKIWSIGPNGKDENGAGDDISEIVTIQPTAPEDVANRAAPGP